MLKTKKDIYEWWIGIGKYPDPRNDLKDFLKKASKDFRLTGAESVATRGDGVVKIMKESWKYPIKLTFVNKECFNIQGY